jgi:CcmD family protein
MTLRKPFLVLALAAALSAPAFAGQTQPPPKPAAQDEFVPIDQLAPKEDLPAVPLVTAAYAIAWLVIFGYVFSLWRRLHKVEAEIADVNRRLTSGARK